MCVIPIFSVAMLHSKTFKKSETKTVKSTTISVNTEKVKPKVHILSQYIPV